MLHARVRAPSTFWQRGGKLKGQNRAEAERERDRDRTKDRRREVSNIGRTRNPTEADKLINSIARPLPQVLTRAPKELTAKEGTAKSEL
eukprot:15484549-Alexandrium_andersonii.AAC.1